MLRAPMFGLPVTAISAVNGLGSTLDRVFSGLHHGQTGLVPCPPEFRVTTFVGKVDDGEFPTLALHGYESRQARMCLLGLAEILEPVRRAVDRWGAGRVALVVGTSTGGIAESEKARTRLRRDGALPATYDYERQHALHAMLHVIAESTGIAGPRFVVSTACSSSAKVFGDARRLVATGMCDAALVGGVDTLAQITLRGFHSLEVLATERCRPFSRERAGINIGEGAAFVLLERPASGVIALGDVHLLGVGESSDAHHMTAPHPEGLGARQAMASAIEQAGLDPSEIEQVNAHATATRMNDASEGRAIRELLGERVKVVATKGYTGHMLGAAGATEAVFLIDGLARSIVPASLGADPLDETIGVDVSLRAEPFAGRFGLSNSFAFGGSNVSVLFGRCTPSEISG